MVQTLKYHSQFSNSIFRKKSFFESFCILQENCRMSADKKEALENRERCLENGWFSTFKYFPFKLRWQHFNWLFATPPIESDCLRETLLTTNSAKSL